MTTPPTKLCRNCKARNPVFVTVQLNLTEWRCGNCNYFMEAVDYPSNIKPSKLRAKES